MAQKIITDAIRQAVKKLIASQWLSSDDPFLLFDLESALQKALRFKTSAATCFSQPEIAYSYKSNSLAMWCQALSKQGFSAEVASMDEMRLALQDGFSPDHIIFDGPLKQDAELRFAVEQGIRIQIDNAEEVTRLHTICRECQIPCAIYVRLSHFYDDNLSRFGLNEGEFITLYQTQLRDNPLIQFKGFHLHVGSNLASTDKLCKTLQDYAPLLAVYMPEQGHLDLGSGFPSDSFSSDPKLPTPDPELFFASIKARLQAIAGEAYQNWRIIFEPGRHFVEDAGYWIGKIISSKPRYHANVLQTNLGINWIPSVRNWHHSITPLAATSPNAASENQIIAGFNCFEGDCLFPSVKQYRFAVGDYFIIRGCGAYDLQTANLWTRKQVSVIALCQHELRLCRLPQVLEEFRARHLMHGQESLCVNATLTLFPADWRFSNALFQVIQSNKTHFSVFMAWPAKVNHVKDTADFLNRCALSHQTGTSKTYVIVVESQAVGVLSLNSIDAANKTAYVGYWLDQNQQGKGIITHALQEVMRHYAQQGSVRRFVIKCATMNASSNRVAVRCGFTLEGVLKHAEYLNGVFHDQNSYAKII